MIWNKTKTILLYRNINKGIGIDNILKKWYYRVVMTGNGNLFMIVVNAFNNGFRMDLSSSKNVVMNCVDWSGGWSLAGTLTLAYIGFRFDLEFRLAFIRIADGTTDGWFFPSLLHYYDRTWVTGLRRYLPTYYFHISIK